MNKVKISPKSRINYTTLQKKYGGMYVLSDKPRGKVIAASRDLEKAFKEADEKGYPNAAVEYIDPPGVIINYGFKVLLQK